jgi:quercetin dioxygenase-like cupin family protein
MTSNVKLDDMVRGWFVGNFEPTAFRTDTCEAACKHYAKGDREARHHHRLATEVTLVLAGRARMNGAVWKAGDIVVIEPFVSTDFEALEDTTTVVIKVPGAPDDKYDGYSERER